MSIPKGWEEVRLGDIISIKSEKYTPNKNEVKKCIELEHLEQNTGILLEYTNSNLQKSTKNVFKKGQVLFGKLRPYLKKYYLAEFDGVCSSEIWVMSGNNVLNNFLFYLVQSDDFMNAANISCGTKMPRADWKYMQEITIKLPPLKEQEKIAEILSSCDEHIKNLKNLKSELEKEKLHLMNELLSGKTRFSSFTTPWQEVAIKDIFQEYTKLNSDNYDQYTIGKNGIKPFEDKRHSITNHKTFKKNDLIIGIGIDEVNININIENGCCSPIYHIYNLNEEKLNPIFGYFAIKTLIQPIKGKIIKTSTRRQFEFTHSEFLKYFLILPSLEEQKKIGEVLSVCDERLECLNELITAQTTLKSHLLTELLTGNIRV